MNVLLSILAEFGPCAPIEVLDYLRSNIFCQRNKFSSEEWTQSKIRHKLNNLVESNKIIFKFESKSGFKVRYGLSRFKYYLLQEPRFLRVKGYIKRCMFCGMPIYIEDSNVFHFQYKCKQYTPQEHFKLMKVDTFWVIISRDYVYGILDDLQSSALRLPGKINNKSSGNSFSELWLINECARKQELIEPDRLLPIKAEEFIA
ncbi:MAG: hypothetical protein JW891_04145 [Candidatus Lokiarchaeota archaeon]|nr:hypothetical protein [Candidatus Lokiarchaeota archaeon]